MIERFDDSNADGVVDDERDTRVVGDLADGVKVGDVELRAGLSEVINATGVILHTGLGRAPLPGRSADAAAAAARGYADLEVARSQVRGTLALARSQRWKLQRAMEDVDDTVAQLPGTSNGDGNLWISRSQLEAEMKRCYVFKRGAQS